MSDGFVLRLPVPPSVNSLTFNLPRGGRAKTRLYQDWLAQADKYLLLQKRALTPVHGPYEVTISVSARLRGDVDNRAKAAIDFLVSRELTDDDRHCQAVKVEKLPGLDGCYVEVKARGSA